MEAEGRKLIRLEEPAMTLTGATANDLKDIIPAVRKVAEWGKPAISRDRPS
jgi:hypothetical protein